MSRSPKVLEFRWADLEKEIDSIPAPKTPPKKRRKRSVYKFDRNEVARMLREEGQQATLAKFPRYIVRAVARQIDFPWRDKRNKWNPVWDKLLGTIPDDQLGIQMGICTQSVKKRRKSLSIPGITWKRLRTAASIEKAAQISDQDYTNLSIDTLSARHSVPALYLTLEKKKRGIGTYKKKHADYNHGNFKKLIRAAIRGMQKELEKDPEDNHGKLVKMGKVLHLTRERVRQIVAELEIDDQKESTEENIKEVSTEKALNSTESSSTSKNSTEKAPNPTRKNMG